MPHSAGKIRRLRLRQRFHLQNNFGRSTLHHNSDITSPVKDGVHNVYGRIVLGYTAIKGYSRNMQFPRTLRKNDILHDHSGPIHGIPDSLHI